MKSQRTSGSKWVIIVSFIPPIKALQEFRDNKELGRHEILVEWLGFPEAAKTWESVRLLLQHSPKRTKHYLAEHEDVSSALYQTLLGEPKPQCSSGASRNY